MAKSGQIISAIRMNRKPGFALLILLCALLHAQCLWDDRASIQHSTCRRALAEHLVIRGGKSGVSGFKKSKLSLREEKRRERIARGRRLEKAEGRNQRQASRKDQSSKRSKWSTERALKQAKRRAERKRQRIESAKTAASPSETAASPSKSPTVAKKSSREEKDAGEDLVILDEHGRKISSKLPKLIYASDVVPGAEMKDEGFHSKLKPVVDADGNIYFEDYRSPEELKKGKEELERWLELNDDKLEVKSKKSGKKKVGKDEPRGIAKTTKSLPLKKDSIIEGLKSEISNLESKIKKKRRDIRQVIKQAAMVLKRTSPRKKSSKQTLSRSASTQLQTHEVEKSNVTTATPSAEKSFGAVDSFLQRLQSYTPDKPLAQIDIEQLKRAEEERRKVEEAREKEPSRLYADSEESSAVPTFEEQMGPCNEYGDFLHIKPFNKTVYRLLPPMERLFKGHTEEITFTIRDPAEQGLDPLSCFADEILPLCRPRISPQGDSEEDWSTNMQTSAQTPAERDESKPSRVSPAQNREKQETILPGFSFEKPKPGDILITKGGAQSLVDAVNNAETQNTSKRIFLGEGYHEYSGRLHLKFPVMLFAKKGATLIVPILVAPEADWTRGGQMRSVSMLLVKKPPAFGQLDPLFTITSQVGRIEWTFLNCELMAKKRDVLKVRSNVTVNAHVCFLGGYKQEAAEGCTRCVAVEGGGVEGQQARLSMTGCSLAFGKTGIVTGGNAKVSMKHSSVQNFNLGCQMLDAAQMAVTNSTFKAIKDAAFRSIPLPNNSTLRVENSSFQGVRWSTPDRPDKCEGI